MPGGWPSAARNPETAARVTDLLAEDRHMTLKLMKD
jgi:hypothetical protein